jgi:hypothetical protein
MGTEDNSMHRQEDTMMMDLKNVLKGIIILDHKAVNKCTMNNLLVEDIECLRKK